MSRLHLNDFFFGREQVDQEGPETASAQDVRDIPIARAVTSAAASMRE
jgi:hypothetical protein